MYIITSFRLLACIADRSLLSCTLKQKNKKYLHKIQNIRTAALTCTVASFRASLCAYNNNNKIKIIKFWQYKTIP